MLKVKIDEKNNDFAVQVEGKLPEILTDITVIFKMIYEKFDEDTKEIFNAFVEEELAKKKMYAKSNEEIETMNKEAVKNAVKELFELLGELKQ